MAAEIMRLSRLPELQTADQAPSATLNRNQARGLERQAMIAPAVLAVKSGASVRSAAAALHWELSLTGIEPPSQKTLGRWITAATAARSLAPKHKGRIRKAQAWDARALYLYQQPTAPNAGTIAIWLQQEGHDVQAHQVRRLLKSVPSNKAETSPKRLGRHYYNQNIKPHVVRDTSVIPVGHIYEGDGHCCDVYVADAAGAPYRPEITVWIDVRSHYVVGWWLSETEGGLTTLFSLSDALVSQNHVCAFVHTDPGSGFKARLITDETVGFLKRFSIDPIFALPGNARGKGLIEGWFRWFEERLGKLFPTFCGHCRTDDALSRLRQRIRRGEMELPSLKQYADAIREYVEWYNNNPQEGLDNKSPAELWATLERVPLDRPADAVLRPSVTCKVRHWQVTFKKRTYRHPALAAYEKRQVRVEYHLHHDDLVWIYDASGNVVCEAVLVKKKPGLPQSHVVEGTQRQLEGRLKRLQANAAEMQARAFGVITTANVVEQLSSDLPLPPAPVATAVDERLHAQVAEQVRENTTPESPEQRFALYLELSARKARGEGLEQGQSQWLASYRTTSEFRAHNQIYKEFGTLSGLADEGK